MAKKMGRPSPYTPELGAKICRAIATSVDSMTKICADNEDFPQRECIWGWRIDYPEFGHMYDNAKRIQADLLVEELNEIADNTTNDTIIKTDKRGEEYEVANTEWIARSRLRVDTRKWVASKMMPKVYGDKKEDESKNDSQEIREAIIAMKELAQKCLKNS